MSPLTSPCPGHHGDDPSDAPQVTSSATPRGHHVTAPPIDPPDVTNPTLLAPPLPRASSSSPTFPNPLRSPTPRPPPFRQPAAVHCGRMHSLAVLKALLPRTSSISLIKALRHRNRATTPPGMNSALRSPEPDFSLKKSERVIISLNSKLPQRCFLERSGKMST